MKIPMIKNVLFASLSAVFVVYSAVYADVQTNALPQIQAIYGGTLRAVDAIALGGATNTTRLFVSTESANSVFYADVDHAATKPFDTNSFSFHVVPDLDANANRGIVSGIAGHPASGRLFIADDAGLLSCTIASNSLVTNISTVGGASVNFSAVLIRDSVLLAIGRLGNSNMLFFGTLDASGNLTQGAGSPIAYGSTNSSPNAPDMLVSPSNNLVYIMEGEDASGIKESSAAYNALSGTTTFTPIALPAAVSAWTGRRLGIGPSGRLFIGGGSANKMIAFSDNDGASWTSVNTGIGGTSGANIESVQTPLGNYLVMFGAAMSTNYGASNSWSSIPQDPVGSTSTHANDGVNKSDPLDPFFFYLTTDQGIGVSTNGGMHTIEIDNGLEAVQINDYDMTVAKDVAWTASKSGLRRGTGSASSLEWTPNGIFPLNDGAGYYSIAIDKSVTAGTTIYGANDKIYKTTDGGTNWTRIWNSEGNTNGFQGTGHFAALAASGQNVVAGFYDPGDTRGGLLINSDGGSNWAQVMSLVDVNDILLMTNGTLLVAVAYDSSTGAGGIFNVSAGNIVTHELTNAVSIRSLAEDSSGGVYASGQTTQSAPRVYYRAALGSAWTEVTTNGLPPSMQGGTGQGPVGPVMTVGRDSSSNDLLIIAIDVTLYYLPSGAASWLTSDALIYPQGSQINVLYWDDLMVGTSEGLYGQAISTSPDTNQMASIALAADFDGDAKADPAIYNTNPSTGSGQAGNWKIKLSSSGYSLLTLTGFLGGTNYTALAADFDGDAKADPAVYYAELELWAVKLSSIGYLAPTVLTDFGGEGWQALAGDFDGDAKADPALYNTNGTWQVKLSTAGYALVTTDLLGRAGWTAVAADFDGDGKVDPAIYNAASGSWIVMLSAVNYNLAVLEPGFLGTTGYAGLAADFDGDGYADPAVAQTATGDWKIKLSSGNYSLLDLPDFLGE